MPTYEYQCKKCGYVFEELQSFTEPVLTTCPKCNTENLARVLGGGSGVIFKGSGFYLTDYKKSNTSPSTPASSSAPKKESTETPAPTPPPAKEKGDPK